MAPKKRKAADSGDVKSSAKSKKVEKKPTKPESKTKKTKADTKTYPKEITPESIKNMPTELKFTATLPSKNDHGELVFDDHKEFRPNMTPSEVLQAGSFGGTYYRPISSSITGKKYSGEWKELPSEWLKGLEIGKTVSSSTYREGVNTYGVKCGGSLEMWEESGWMHPQDPYGWFQWYCRFYRGRRTLDDERQIGRWLRCAGVTGRWRNNLISKCAKAGCAFDNKAVSPVVRQTLQHWAYTLNKRDFDAYVKKKNL